MQYIGTKDAAIKLGVTERSIRNYCKNGKIKGAIIRGKTWMIPSNFSFLDNEVFDKSSIKTFDDIFYGTQYYRSPTPLENEWDEDLTNLGKYNIDTFQIRINWRNNERQENVYNFDDVEKLLKLAKKHNKKVVMKLLLECAPQYVFDKYHGTRIGPRGEQIRGGSHGAFYAGGWTACFTNPQVAKRAKMFVREVARRFYQDESIIMWNAWNEPRNKPVEECFCPECRKAYGRHLARKFGTIDKLNNFYGVCEDSFEHIALPIMAHGVWDMYEFKLFKSQDCLYNNVKFVYDAIREFDKTRPIMSHIGFTSAYQDHLGDCNNDFVTSKAVDFWGTSVPCDTTMDTKDKRLDFNMLNDFLYCVDPNYFVYEIYPGLGMYRYPYDTVFDMDYKLYNAIAGGAKGLCFWQYRSERVGNEGDCAGLVRMDGSPRPVINSVKEFGDNLLKDGKLLRRSLRKRAEVAIVFDYNSSTLSEIEDSFGVDFTMAPYWTIKYYRNAHDGFHRLLRRNDYPVDYVGSPNIEQIHNYKVIYIPYMAMLNKTITNELEKYVANGGVVIADEGFGLRQSNTWINPYDIEAKPLLNARIVERRRKECYAFINGNKYLTKPNRTDYKVENAKVISTFEDGLPSIQMVEHGKGKFYLCGFSLGYCTYNDENPIYLSIFEELVKGLSIKKNKYSNFKEELEEKRLTVDDKEIVFLFNSSKEERIINIEETIISKSTKGTLSNNILTLKGQEMCYLIVKGK